jgi:hypothetical protein
VECVECADATYRQGGAHVTIGYEVTLDMPRVDQKAMWAGIAKVINEVLIETATKANKMLDGVVSTWEHKPFFRYWGPTQKGMEFEITFGPTPGEAADIFGYVELGVQPRIIFPVHSRDGLLHFRSDFWPKTTPGSLSSGPGARGGRWVKKKAVAWPGITPRGFIDTVLANLMMEWANDLQTIVDKFGVAFTEAKMERVVEVKSNG